MRPMLLSTNLTCRAVHAAIQDIAATLPAYDVDISLERINVKFDVENTVLLQHIDVLISLFYIKFTNRTHNNIRLTETGMLTLVPSSTEFR